MLSVDPLRTVRGAREGKREGKGAERL